MNFFRRRDRELNEEIQSHFAMDIRARMERGESQVEAEAAARREFGNVGLVKELTREMWGFASVDRGDADKDTKRQRTPCLIHRIRILPAKVFTILDCYRQSSPQGRFRENQMHALGTYAAL